MTFLRVWAPAAGAVSAVLGGDAVRPMRRGDGGWWRLEAEVESPEADYAFSLDGGPPLPDPRAPRLPYGVGGPGRLVDTSRFAWTDAGWQPPPLGSGVLYELHVGTFTPRGSFDAAIERLDALADLGVTHLQVMPIHSFPVTRGWGYDGVGLFAPHEPYGGPEGFARFVDAAHARGLAVLLDVVYNHLGPSGNHLARFGPYFTDRHRTPWGDAIDLDGPGSHEVRRFLCDNAIHWLRDYHVDGLRLDAVHALFDHSAQPFLAELRDEVDAFAAASGRHRVLVAESDRNDPRLVRSRDAGGLGMDAQWNDDFHHALHAWLTGERGGYYVDFGSAADVAKALRSAFVYDGRFSAFRGRRHGAPADGLSGHRFVTFLQSHDQIGNRAQGERTSHLLGPRRLAVGAALALLAPFVPQLFQGEEWGARTPFLYFTSHSDPDLARAVTLGRRAEFGAAWGDAPPPDPQDPATFERSRLDWSEREREPHASLLDWHRRLIRLRRSHAELCDGRLERIHVACDESGSWLCIRRGRLRIVCNVGDAARHVAVGDGDRADLLLCSDPATRIERGGVTLPPDAVAILRVAREEEKPSWSS